MPNHIYIKQTEKLNDLLERKAIAQMTDEELDYIGLEIALQIKLCILKYHNLRRQDKLHILSNNNQLTDAELIVLIKIIQANGNFDLLSNSLSQNINSALDENTLIEFSQYAFATHRLKQNQPEQRLRLTSMLRIAYTFCHKSKPYQLKKDIIYMLSMLKCIKTKNTTQDTPQLFPNTDASRSHFSMHFLLTKIYNRIALFNNPAKQQYNLERTNIFTDGHLELLYKICQNSLYHDLFNIIGLNATDENFFAKKLDPIVKSILHFKWHTDPSHENYLYARLVIHIALISGMHRKFKLWDLTKTQELMRDFFSPQADVRLKPKAIITNLAFIKKLEAYNMIYPTPRKVLSKHLETIKQFKSRNRKLTLMLLLAFSRSQFRSTGFYGEAEEGLTTTAETNASEPQNNKIKIYLAENKHDCSTLVVHELTHVIQMLYLSDSMFRKDKNKQVISMEEAAIKTIFSELERFYGYQSIKIKSKLQHLATLSLNSCYKSYQYSAEAHAELTTIEVNYPSIFKGIARNCPYTLSWYYNNHHQAYKRAYRDTSLKKRHLWPSPT